MKKKIKSEDIKALLKLFAPEKYSLSLFDPFLRLDNLEDLEVEDFSREHKVLVNLGDEILQFKQYSLDEFDLIINFGECRTDHIYSEKVHYKTNSEGGMRWLFEPRNLRHILATYSANNLRSKLIKFGIGILSALRLGKLFSSGSFEIHTNSKMPFQQFSPTFKSTVVFMGTPGLLRKLTQVVISDYRVVKFVKIPLNALGVQNNTNEAFILDKMGDYNFQSFDYPDAFKLHKLGLGQLNKDQYSHQSNYMRLEYQNALIELLEQTKGQKVLWNLPFISSIQNNIEMLASNSMLELNSHCEMVKRMFKVLDKSRQIKTSIAHGDFTPWNLKHDNHIAYLFDWEYGREDMPVMYDLFHFIIQSSVYTERTFNLKLNEVLLKVQNTRFSDIIENENIDVRDYLRLYILHQMSYHLACIVLDNKISEGLSVQLDVLYRLGAELENEASERSYRSTFLESFQEFLVRSKGYALMKYESYEMKELKESSDLDILVTKDFEKEVIAYIKSLGWRAEMEVVSRSYMSQLRIRFFDGSILFIDLIKEFRRKSFSFLAAHEILEKVMKLPNGLRVPQPEHDFEYALLFYNLNGSNIPEKYIDFFSKNGDFEERIVSYINAKYLIIANEYKELFILKKEARDWLRMIIGHNTRINPATFILSNLQYVLDTLRSVFNDRGFIITFSGVDGSGKSTIIEQFKNELRTIHRKEVISLRHRPRVLPILSAIKYGGVKNAEQRAGEIKPRQGKAVPGISSYLRFGYYYLDYLLGQLVVYYKYILRGKIVLYDRYYFDFIVDSKRSNISISPKVSKRLYSLIFKPKYNFLLWSSPEDVYARKPEVEVVQIDKLNKGYKGLFKQLSKSSNKSKYRVIHNKEIDTTIKEILRECKEVA